MNQVIRIAIGALSLCGALAVLPGVAEAREANRPAAAHVERERGHERGREVGREHGGRGHEGRWHDGRGRRGHGGARRPGC
ncbi:MAG TPA: hypothetical protein VGL81_14925 [Polyangiaceae bacterium]